MEICHIVQFFLQSHAQCSTVFLLLAVSSGAQQSSAAAAAALIQGSMSCAFKDALLHAIVVMSCYL